MSRAIEQAVSLHRQGRLSEAERHYRDALRASPRDFDALNLLGALKLQQGNAAEAVGLISRAIELRPAEVDALCNLSAALMALERYEEVLANCDRILAIRGSEISARQMRGAALVRLGRYAEALISFEQLLAIKPDHAGAELNRGATLVNLGRFDEALASFDRAIALAPTYVDALNNRGNLLVQLDRTKDAVASYDRAIAIDPKSVTALTNRCNALRKLRRYDEALQSVERALALAPDHTESLNSRGNVLLYLHRPQEALDTFDRGLMLQPGDSYLLTNRAFVLHALGRYVEALQSSEAALANDLTHANAYLIRGHILAKLDRPEDAIASYGRALALEPEQPYAFGASVMCHITACNWPGIEIVLPAVQAEISRGAFVIPPGSLFGLPVAPSEQLQCARNYVRQQTPVTPQPLARRPSRSSGKIKLAYLSGDFRMHPVALIANLFERHDRSRFETVGVSYVPDDGSEQRARIAQAFDQFQDVAARSDRDVAHLLNSLDVDIAIDLGGHTENSRSSILSYRPAPIQVNYLGYPGTMGAEFIDYIIADKIILPFEQQPYYSEKIVHLPDCYLPSDSKRPIPVDIPSRLEAGLPESGFVFCCFNNSFKISADIFDLWMRLLGSVDGSVLWLGRVNEATAGKMRAAAIAHDIDPERLIFAPWVPTMTDHLARHRLADLFLDTPRYNAHTTASDALWTGLPVITLVGETFPGRVAASALNALGLPELATSSLEEYEAVALKLAREPAQLDAVRRKISERRSASPLFDIERFSRHIEAAYATMHEIHRRGESPRSFSVDPIAR